MLAGLCGPSYWFVLQLDLEIDSTVISVPSLTVSLEERNIEQFFQNSSAKQVNVHVVGLGTTPLESKANDNTLKGVGEGLFTFKMI